MNSPIKQTIIHGLEVLGVCILVWAIDFFVIQVAPQLPQTAVLGILIPTLASVAKWLRANPNIPVNDYVKGKE
jgi:hypothetical protein